MLRWRLVGAAAILIPGAFLVWLDDQSPVGRPGVYLAPLGLLVAWAACFELNQLLQRAGWPVSRFVNFAAITCAVGGGLAPFAWYASHHDRLFSLQWAALGLMAGTACLFVAELLRYRQPGESLQRIAGGTLLMVYLGIPFACLAQLRLVPPSRLGLAALLATIALVKASDIGAYFVGRACGHHHFSRISPGKTIEGSVGGLMASALMAWWAKSWLLPVMVPTFQTGNLWAYLGWGLTIGFAGMAGDLAESLLKRDARQKDSGHWLAGLGGVMDVLDSVLAAAPVSLLWWLTGLLGQLT